MNGLLNIATKLGNKADPKSTGPTLNNPFFNNNCPVSTSITEAKIKIKLRVFLFISKQFIKMFKYFSSLKSIMDLNKTCHEINSLKIQGAERIAFYGIKALEHTIKSSKSKNKFPLIREANLARKKLLATRVTEPELKNYLDYIINYMKLYRNGDYKKAILKRIKEVLKEKQERKKEIILHGSKLIQRNMTIYTHCHSTSVTGILKEAAKKHKVIVHNTETRPLYQGRITAKELSKANIKTIHYTDSAMPIATENVDMMLIGADAITSKNFYNKTGSFTVALLSKYHRTPLYVCASLWKYSNEEIEIEQRSPKEILSSTSKNIKVHNPAFDRIPLKYVHAFICEEGVLSPKAFVRKAKRMIK